MAATDLMREIAVYDYMDCKAMMEIAGCLRASH